MRQEEFKASLKYIVRSEFEVTMGYMRPFQIKKELFWIDSGRSENRALGIDKSWG